MSCIGAIRKYVKMVSDEEIISTRDILLLGQRNAVDKATSALVKKGELVRVARGLFIKVGSAIPKIEELARKKAKAFGRMAIMHASNFEIESFCKTLEEVLAQPPRYEPCSMFHTHRVTSKFESILGTIKFVGTRSSQIQLGDSKSGKLTRLLLHVGRRSLIELECMLDKLPFEQLKATLDQVKLMPAWLSDRIQRSCFG